MKQYKKALLALSIVATLPLMAATKDDTIYVTTFTDEDGENPSACSLREAITTAADNKAYGGCAVGLTSPDVTDRIELKAGEYTIEKPLTPSSMVNILGETPTDWSNKDIILGEYPERLPLQTTIKGNGSFTLFDTTAGKSTLTLQLLRLEDGRSSRGGAIRAGSTVSLVQVEVKNSSADEGGAIYLSGVGSALNVTNSVFEGNTAKRGAVLGMSCIDNLTFTSRTVSFLGSSIINNGQADTTSVMEACGEPDFSIKSSTVAHNTASLNNGSIIKFTGDSLPGQNGKTILSAGGKLTLLSNTIVNNTATSTLLYDAFGSKALNYNILAYNTGLSCKYLLSPNFPENSLLGFSVSFNGLMESESSSSYCELPYETLKDETSINLSNVSQSSVMSTLQPADQYTAFLPMYFLTNPLSNVMINVGDQAGGCEPTDQRGLNRSLQDNLILDENTENRCDLGSTEFIKLAANDMVSSNSSQVKAVEEFEAQEEFFQELLDDEETNPDFLKYYEIRRDYFKQRNVDFKESLRYRQAYFDIFAGSVPAEILVNGNREIQHLDADLYNVEVISLGMLNSDVFSKDDPSGLPVAGSDPHLKCEWNAALEAVVMYRTDFKYEQNDEGGGVTQAGNYNYCKYTISLKADPTIKSTGVVQATFTNIAPIAENDEYTMKWGTDQRVKIDLLTNDSDDGDGAIDQVGYPSDKPTFYKNAQGISIPIKFDEVDSNLLIEADYRELCPDQSRKWCYGGNIYVKPKNSFNKFNYTLTYQVFDADGTLSNTATVKLISTATTTDDTRGGGGALGILSVLGLLGLALLRQRKS